MLAYEPVLVTCELRGKSVRDFFFFKFYLYKKEKPMGGHAFLFWICVCMWHVCLLEALVERRDITADLLKMSGERWKTPVVGAAVLDNIFVPLYEPWSPPTLIEVIRPYVKLLVGFSISHTEIIPTSSWHTTEGHSSSKEVGCTQFLLVAARWGFFKKS